MGPSVAAMAMPAGSWASTVCRMGVKSDGGIEDSRAPSGSGFGDDQSQSWL